MQDRANSSRAGKDRLGKRLAGTAARARRGFTLVELAMGMGLASIMLGVTYYAAQRVGSSMHQGISVAGLQATSSEGVRRVADILREARAESLSLPFQDPVASDSGVKFRTALGYEGGIVQESSIQTLALVPTPLDPINDLDDDGDGLIDEMRLVWGETDDLGNLSERVLIENVKQTLEGEIPGNNKDDNGNGLVDEPGFVISRESEGRLQVQVTTILQVSGETLERTGSVMIRLIN